MLESDRPAIKLALVVEYDGTNYKGFQYQSKLPTIQGELSVGSRFPIHFAYSAVSCQLTQTTG